MKTRLEKIAEGSCPHFANINPDLLIWGRQMSGMPSHVAAKKIGVSVENLKDWESGKAQPTIKQLRSIANTYEQNFAAFFLQEAPPAPEVLVAMFRWQEWYDKGDL